MKSKKTINIDDFLKKAESISSNLQMSKQDKLNLKKSILNSLEYKPNINHIELVEEARNVFAEVSPNRAWVAKLRELILDNLPVRRPWYLVRFPLFQKTVVSYLLLITFTFSVFATLTMTTSKEVYAKENVLFVENGVVEVRRFGEAIKAETGFFLEEGDVVKTFGDSKAFIKYADGNSTDIDQNTIVYLETLNIEDDFSRSDITLQLKNGRILNTVYNSFFSDRAFEVKTSNLEVYAFQAVFDVEIRDSFDELMEMKKESKVAVLDSFVDLKVLDDKGQRVSQPTLFKNNLLTLQENGDYQIASFDELTEEDTWLAGHIQKFDQDKPAMAQEMSAKDLDSLSPIKDIAISFLPGEDRDLLKKELRDIQNLLEKAESLRDKGYMGTAQNYLDEVQEKMEAVFMEYGDLNEIKQLSSEVENMISYYRKNRTRFISGSSYDSYMEAFNKLEILVVKDELSYFKALLNQSFEEALYAFAGTDQDSIDRAVENYIANMNKVLELSVNLDEDSHLDLYTQIAEKSAKLAKSIYLAYSEDLDRSQQALIWQQSILNYLSVYNINDIFDDSLANITSILIDPVIIVVKDSNIDLVEDWPATPDIGTELMEDL